VAASSSVCSLSTMPTRRLPTSLASRLTVTQGQGAQVLAVELQQVECQIAFNSDPPFASNNDPTSVRNGRAGLGGPRVVMLGF
jgi:hypothetical protein